MAYIATQTADGDERIDRDQGAGSDGPDNRTFDNRDATVQEFKRFIDTLERPSLFELVLIFSLLIMTGFALQPL